MAAASKLVNVFKKPVCELHCSQLIHPGISCRNFFPSNILGCTKSCAIYFLPLVISQILFKAKNLNRKILSDTLKFYLQTVVCASSANYLGFFYICIFRNVVGKIDLNVTITMPLLSVLTISWFFPQNVMNLYLIATSQASTETIIRVRSNLLTRFIFESKSVQTIVFMISSCIILHNKRSEVYKGFWFITPNPTDNTKNIEDADMKNDVKTKSSYRSRSNCLHAEKSCRKFFFNGIKRYVLIGLSLDLFDIMLHKKISPGTKGVWHMFFAKTKNLKLQNFGMTSFLLGNIGIYRISSCFLRNYFSDKWTELLSSFLSGASYIFIQKLSINTFSLVVAVNILWQLLCTQPSHPQQKHYGLRQNLKMFRFSPFIVALNVAILSHYYVTRYHVVSSLGRAMINGTGNFQEVKYGIVLWETILVFSNGVPPEA